MVEIDHSELKEQIEKLENAKISTLTLGHAWGKWLEKSARTRIRDSKKAPNDTAWTAVSEKYAEYLEKHSIGGSLLMRTGNLYRSVGYDLSKWGSGILILSANTEYARTHQQGRGGITARPFLGLSKKDEIKLKKITTDYVEKVLND